MLHTVEILGECSLLPCARVRSRGRVIVLSVSRFVSLSAPNQDFEQDRLVYGLYLLRMSQKLKNLIVTSRTRVYFREPRKADSSHFLALLKLPFKVVDLFTTTNITIAQAQVNCNQAIVLAYAFMCICLLFTGYSSETNKY